MAVPAAPLELNGDKILFGTYDNGGANEAAVLRARKIAVLNGTTAGELSVYPTSGSLYTGHVSTTGAAAISLVASTLPCQGVLVKAHKENTTTIYMGMSSVTTDNNNTTGGYPLEPGESVGVPTADAIDVWVRGATGDGVAWIASAD